MGESGGEQTSSPDDGPSDASGPPLDGGCPSDIDLFSTAPKRVAVESLDEDTLGDDPRFVDSFCASFCPIAPDDYEMTFCAPVDELDVPPPAADTTDSGTSSDTTGGNETGDSTTESSGSSSSSTTGDDDELIEIRCHYWPGCM